VTSRTPGVTSGCFGSVTSRRSGVTSPLQNAPRSRCFAPPRRSTEYPGVVCMGLPQPAAAFLSSASTARRDLQQASPFARRPPPATDDALAPDVPGDVPDTTSMSLTSTGAASQSWGRGTLGQPENGRTCSSPGPARAVIRINSPSTHLSLRARARSPRPRVAHARRSCTWSAYGPAVKGSSRLHTRLDVADLMTSDSRS